MLKLIWSRCADAAVMVLRCGDSTALLNTSGNWVGVIWELCCLRRLDWIYFEVQLLGIIIFATREESDDSNLECINSTIRVGATRRSNEVRSCLRGIARHFKSEETRPTWKSRISICRFLTSGSIKVKISWRLHSKRLSHRQQILRIVDLQLCKSSYSINTGDAKNCSRREMLHCGVNGVQPYARIL